MSIDLTKKELDTLRLIRNEIVHHGESPSIRKLMKDLKYKSPNSVVVILSKLIETGFLIKNKNGKIKLLKDMEENTMHGRTINIPLVGSAPCGAPFLAEENIEAEIPVSSQLARPPYRYFLLRVMGDSMNLKGIDDGDLVLVRQQETAENGDIVVALIDDEATIKEFERTSNVVLLKPKSKNKKHKPFVLTENFIIQGKVISTIPNFD